MITATVLLAQLRKTWIDCFCRLWGQIALVPIKVLFYTNSVRQNKLLQLTEPSVFSPVTQG